MAITGVMFSSIMHLLGSSCCSYLLDPKSAAKPTEAREVCRSAAGTEKNIVLV